MVHTKKCGEDTDQDCTKMLQAVRDALYVINGK